MLNDLKEIMLECVALNSNPMSEYGCCKEMVKRDILRGVFIFLWAVKNVFLSKKVINTLEVKRIRH